MRAAEVCELGRRAIYFKVYIREAVGAHLLVSQEMGAAFSYRRGKEGDYIGLVCSALMPPLPSTPRDSCPRHRTGLSWAEKVTSGRCDSPSSSKFFCICVIAFRFPRLSLSFIIPLQGTAGRCPFLTTYLLKPDQAGTPQTTNAQYPTHNV